MIKIKNPRSVKSNKRIKNNQNKNKNKSKKEIKWEQHTKKLWCKLEV